MLPIVIDLEVDDDPVFTLLGGRSYVIHVSHVQSMPRERLEGVRASLVGTAVRKIAAPQFDAGSRHHIVGLEVYAAELRATEKQEIAIFLEPDGEICGPEIQLRLRVLRSAARTARDQCVAICPQPVAATRAARKRSRPN